jgi:glycerophosphoryl diester phosphodiesterase
VGSFVMRRIAHRGLHEDHPENSRAAVLGAFESAADGVEVDLHRLRDGRIVFHHDAVIQGTGHPPDYHDLAGLTLDQLRELLDHEPITLSDALEEKPTNKQLILECKPPRSSLGFCRTLLTILRQHQPENILLSSESWHLLHHLAQLSDYPLAPVVRSMEGLNRTYLSRSFFREVHLRYNLALEEATRTFFQDRDIPIVTWTVNDPSIFEQLKKLGIDGVMTDNESLLRVD